MTKTTPEDVKRRTSAPAWHQHPPCTSLSQSGNRCTLLDCSAGSDDEEDFTPRDAEGNELAVDMDPATLTAAQLQEELTKRGLDVKWQPLKGKKVLVERLQVWVAGQNLYQIVILVTLNNLPVWQLSHAISTLSKPLAPRTRAPCPVPIAS